VQGGLLYVLRHLAAILVLPVTVVLVVPVWVGRRYHVAVDWPRTPTAAVVAFVGLGVLLVGLILFGTSLREFFSHGRGTLAPWDPPRRLIVRGPYRYVRHPMIAGVIFTLFGVALALRSLPHAVWAGTFLIINAIYIPLLEEPMLAQRFGPEYARYRRCVRRFVPRFRPWDGA
jgi:protein-S-isoprenylcysteine O-methyltransferase Ste14